MAAVGSIANNFAHIRTEIDFFAEPMHELRSERIDELLENVIELDPAERAAFLADAELSESIREEILHLLSFEADASSAFDRPAIEFSRDFFDAAGQSLIGERVDVYRLVREVGSGGMGTVFLAERIDGKLDQRVALKLLRRSLNTSALRSRFADEGKILGSLEHPSIARLLNAGTTDDGIPFLAIEFVNGLPIDEYCSHNSIKLEGRLRMFVEICKAVGFAHRNLVIHRDLKPSNILVDTNGNAKLLDFGISKIIANEADDAESATFTQMGAMTPAYASPEQLERKSTTVATDIYSLGVILYELVSGTRPFREKESDLRSNLDAVVTQDPPLPSAAARTNRNRNEDAGSADAVHPIKWQQLRGDIDTIILKALKKEPERRYSSAEAFADDIERYLEGRPVLARPDTFIYRTDKFVRRNLLAVGSSAIVLLAIVFGIGSTLWQARQTALAAEQAKLESAKKKEALDFVGSILNFANPFWHSPNPERKRQATIAEAMDLATKKAEEELNDKPEVQAEILFILGKAHMGKGDPKTAERLIAKAISNYDAIHGTENLRSMHFRGHLANQLYMQTRFSEAEAEYRKAVEYLRPRLNENEETPAFLAGSLTGLGNIYLLRGEFESAAALNQEALSIASNFSGNERRMVPVLMGNLGMAFSGIGELDRAESYFQQALAETSSNGTVENADAANFLRELGLIASMRGELDKAEQLLQRSYDIASRTVGNQSIYTLDIANHLTRVYLSKQDLGKAKTLIERNETEGSRAFPDGNFILEVTRSLKGELYTRQGETLNGEMELRRALEYIDKNIKGPNAQTAFVEALLGRNLLRQKRYEEAREILTKSHETLVKKKGPGHPETLNVKNALSEIPSS